MSFVEVQCQRRSEVEVVDGYMRALQYWQWTMFEVYHTGTQSPVRSVNV